MTVGLRIITTNQFEKDVCRMKKRRCDMRKLKHILELLINNQSLPQKYKNHKLKGNFVGRWECHIEPDWLLIYSLSSDLVKLERTGSHFDLFS